MEKEQIVKALECCANYRNFGDCDKCPAREGCDTENNFLEKEAISLIREQDKRIEELTLENVGFEAGAKAAAKFIRVDTVQKYREKLYRELASLGAKDKFNKEFFLTKVDKIANKLLEETT